ncbi:MAG: response regulator [Gemmatimonadales bacterium]
MLRLSRLRLLLVEDNDGDAMLALERLTEAREPSMEATHVATLEEAQAVLRDETPDAIVLDLNLPDSAGLDTFYRLRREAPDVPLVVLSGALSPQQRDELMGAGAVDCLTKTPSPFEVLLRSIRLSVALRRAEGQQHQVERLLASSPDAVLVVDAAGLVRFVNQAALNLFGKRREDFIGELLTFATPANQLTELEILCGTERRSGEMRTVTVEWEGHPAILASIRDMTESRRLAAQLTQAQKMEAIGHLAGGVAHDFNNLITVILAYGSAIKETLQDGDPRREDLSHIMAAADRAKSLTRQLLAFARRHPQQVQTVRLGTLADGVRALLLRALPEHTSLTVHTAPDVWEVEADPGQLEQVLINLAVNANDAMGRGGQITITIDNQPNTAPGMGWTGGDAVRLCMRDTGEGIPPEHLSKIFDPFFTTKEPGKGTGLGLATCYGIIRQAGGMISVESEVGKGSAFIILLPRALGTRPLPAHQPRLHHDVGLDGHETILVVEDDEALRRSVVRVLRRYGYTVLAATNGEEGQRVIEGHDGLIDLIVTDLIMPKMGGGELVDYLRRARPDTRILCMTGYAVRPGDPSTGLREGVEVIYKPFEPVELVQRIRGMLEDRDAPPRA